MKKSYAVLVALITLVLILVFIFFTSYFQQDAINLTFDDNSSEKSRERPEYHFIIIAQNTDDSYWQAVKKGAQQAAKDFNAVIEFNGPRITNPQEELQNLDIAIASRVDGIVTHVLDEQQSTPLINKASDLNIPVVTIEADAKDSRRKAFIGTSNFKLGNEAGKLMAAATGGKAKVGVILNGYDDNKENIDQNIKLAGFKDAIKAYPEIEVKTVQLSKMGILSAEEVTQGMLNSFPDINAIYCTSSKDTIGVAQMVVDFNRVGSINIIGYDDLPEILHYVEKGVIYGTVAGDPEKMGYEAIKSLVELKKKNRTSSYVDTGVHVITSENLKEYSKLLEDKKGNEASK